MKELEELIEHITKILESAEKSAYLSTPNYIPIALPQMAFYQLRVKLTNYQAAERKISNTFQVEEPK